MKKYVLSSLIAIALLLTGCPKKIDDNYYFGLYPREIEYLQSTSYYHSVTAVGIGAHANLSIAKKKAKVDAVRKTIKQVQSELDIIRKDLYEGANPRYIEHCTQTSDYYQVNQKQTNSEVEILTITKQREDGSFEVYSLYYFPISKWLPLIDQEAQCIWSSKKSFKEIPAYKQLKHREKKEEILLGKETE